MRDTAPPRTDVFGTLAAVGVVPVVEPDAPASAALAPAVSA